MKKIHLYIAAPVMALFATGCAHEDLLFNIEGEGNLVLTPVVKSDMKVVSRADEQELLDSCMIWISNDKGLVRRYDNSSEIPTGPIPLLVGHYVAEAWTGDSVPASWDDRWFKGLEHFDITAGETAQVKLECKIANVGVSIEYDNTIDDVLSNYSATVGHKGGSLTYEGRESRRGYFMMPSFDKNLGYELKGTQIDGSDFTETGVIENAKPGYEYIIKVKYEPSTTEVGGSVFAIEIEENEMVVNQEIYLIPAPRIVGYGFDINSPLMAEQGTLGRRSVYVASATKVTEIQMRSDLFLNIPEIGGNDFELLGMNAVGKAAVENAGINYKFDYNSEADETLVQINFEQNFTNSLENGDYTIEFTAIDKYGKSTTKTLTILISDAPVVTAAPTSVSYFTATLRGTASREDVSSVGFDYRKVGDDAWTHVEATLEGLDFHADIKDLIDRTQYEYVATSDGYASPIKEQFTTLSGQLPNSGFEDWYQYNGKIWIPGKDYSNNYFWDSGNHGGSLVSKNFTTQNATYKHSGNYSACLKSEKVLIQFAAGNIFAGKYLATDGTNGILGWGRPFNLSPKSVNIWVKYNPVKIASNGTYKKKDDMDEGIIYIALVDDTKQTYKDENWPIVVKTKAAERNLFSKDDANVIAYGERVFTSATEGNDLILVNIPLEYFKPGMTPSNIIFVASASRYGDYFEGGDGSTMYIDDVELLYY